MCPPDANAGLNAIIQATTSENIWVLIESNSLFVVWNGFKMILGQTDIMQNDAGERVDLYIPRKCSASNRLITSKDHAAVQINFANVDERGVYNGEVTTFAICGYLRQQARSDNSINRLAQEAGLIQTSHKF
jgi:small subunit ribosomal protein S21e